jgi:hypothetical protein
MTINICFAALSWRHSNDALDRSWSEVPFKVDRRPSQCHAVACPNSASGATMRLRPKRFA